MTTIPFAEALKLLDNAYDIHVPGYSETKSFSLDTAEGAYAFLELDLEEGDNEFFFRFLESANQTVKVAGDIMTLIYDEAVCDGVAPEIEIKLMVPLVIETPRDEVHKHQCQLESSLNRIREACGDSSNLPVIRDHVRAAKESFDWLDNFTVMRLPPASIPITRDKALPVIQRMRAKGGGFCKHLAEAMLHADEDNLQTLIDAFPAYWEVYTQRVAADPTPDDIY